LIQNYKKDYSKWIKMAEEAIKKSDYKNAARLLRYVSVYFGLINDQSNQKKFIMKAGDCYFQAAKNSENARNPLKTILLYVKAAKCFREGGNIDLAQTCDLLIRKHHVAVKEDYNFYGSISDLKNVGDYFQEVGDDEIAAKYYYKAAEDADKQGKMALSGSLYVNVGDRYRALGDFKRAAENYERAADRYFKSQRYFEAARYYCESGFLYVNAGSFKEASFMADKADNACAKGQIDILLGDLIAICRLLSKGKLQRAMEYWNKIRRKFKRSYAELIDSCFQAVRWRTSN